jgi:hypothetical protein
MYTTTMYTTIDLSLTDLLHLTGGILMTELALSTLTAVAKRIQARELSPVELTRQLLDRIHALDTRFHSYVTGG